MPISIQQISYIHPDKEVLFSDLNFAISKGQKLGLVGNNGCGKSTLLQIIAGQLTPSSGVMDEPTNHLDSSGRQRLYDWVEKWRSTLLVVSHDRTLLNLLPEICELEKHQISYYGGNYEFYKEQKTLMQEALQQRIEEKEKALRTSGKNREVN